MWVLHEPDRTAYQGAENPVMDKPFRPAVILMIYTSAFLIMSLFYVIPVQLPLLLLPLPISMIFEIDLHPLSFLPF